MNYTLNFRENIGISDTCIIQVKRSLYKRYLILAKELYLLSEPSKKTPLLGEQRLTRLVGCTLMLCFALEAFVNDILFCKFPKIADQIEKLSLMKKLKKIMKIKSFCFVLSPEYAIAKDLINTRNIFAHYKPKYRLSTEEEEVVYNSITHQKVADFYRIVIKIFKCIVKLYKLETLFDWLIDYNEDIE